MRCTGECCRKIAPLSHSLEEIRIMKDSRRDPEAAKLWVLFRPVDRADRDSEVRCVALTETGCALPRDQRPGTCTHFPYGGDKPCYACGAASDAEARGVALVHVKPPILLPASSL